MADKKPYTGCQCKELSEKLERMTELAEEWRLDALSQVERAARSERVVKAALAYWNNRYQNKKDELFAACRDYVSRKEEPGDQM